MQKFLKINPPVQIDWDKFIKAGFDGDKDKQYADRWLKDNQPDTKPRDNDLHLRFYEKDGIVYHTVCCSCGNNRMTVHENGIRCQICGRFHTHDNFLRMKEKARQKAKINDQKIAKTNFNTYGNRQTTKK